MTVILAVVTLLRPPARRHDSRWWVFPICLLSICYNLGYRFDPTRGSSMLWIFWGRVALQVIASGSLMSLGLSYGMLPALRQVRTGLLYGLVRHPVYALYIVADLCVVSLQPSWWNAGVAALGATLFYLRASLEERVLRTDPVYTEYMRQVRWRFFPGLH
jgi:protein-S-isoprenylcysteine O-methyltransferase Ste14